MITVILYIAHWRATQIVPCILADSTRSLWRCPSCTAAKFTAAVKYCESMIQFWSWMSTMAGSPDKNRIKNNKTENKNQALKINNLILKRNNIHRVIPYHTTLFKVTHHPLQSTTPLVKVPRHPLQRSSPRSLNNHTTLFKVAIPFIK